MRIITWNVNGLRAVLRRNALAPVLELNPDVLCLQEIKAKAVQVPLEDQQIWSSYQDYWNPARRAGYSGVLTLVQPEVEAINHGMGIEKFDQEGRLSRIDFETFTLFNVYFPNGQRDHTRLTYKLEFYEQLLDICKQIHREGRQIIIAGDFNTSHQEIDLRNPKQNINTSGFLPEERDWIDRYLAHNFCDVYRLLYPDRVEYTWWTYRFGARQRNVGWRLDYFLVSEGLVAQVQDVDIHTTIEGSDHCPVSIVLKE